jgi:kynurenine 3-monooxygenase
MAIMLAQAGHRVTVYERRADPRTAIAEQGRSINLALAERGLRALAAAKVLDAITPLMVRMPGRMIHEIDGTTRLLRYGQRSDEVIWSINRAVLNRALILAAAVHPNVTLQFNQRCLDIDPATARLTLRDENTGSVAEVSAANVIATDGAGSAVRGALAHRDLCQVSEEFLDHDYKELHIAPAAAGGYRFDPHGLHIWPRGGFMLIALPNADGSLTATLFLPRQGSDSFESLQDTAAIHAFFSRYFADVVPHLPDLTMQFTTHPQGQLGTVHCWPWTTQQSLLLGDAAHAIVPFHGQGLNCGFEDCLKLDALLARHSDVAIAFSEYEHERRSDTDAIAIMALENYGEMRDGVRHADFEIRRELALQLERRFPRQFIPRYSMVMFHPEICYADALQRGHTQQRILDALVAEGADAASNRATTLIAESGL